MQMGTNMMTSHRSKMRTHPIGINSGQYHSRSWSSSKQVRRIQARWLKNNSGQSSHYQCQSEGKITRQKNPSQVAEEQFRAVIVIASQEGKITQQVTTTIIYFTYLSRFSNYACYKFVTSYAQTHARTHGRTHGRTDELLDHNTSSRP